MPDEVQRLRAALRDVVALSAIPAAWVGREPAGVAYGLADVLMSTLHLGFVFVRLSDPDGGADADASRGDAWSDFSGWLQHHLMAVGRRLHKQVIPDVGGSSPPCRGFIIPVGVNASGGLVAVACDRPDFPTETDQLLLNVAVNHAAIGFESARLIHQRHRTEEELRQARTEEALSAARRELALVSRRTTMAAMSAGIAHEIKQPLTAIVTNAAAGLRWLASTPPKLDDVQNTLNRIVADGHRAGEVIDSVRTIFGSSGEQAAATFDVNGLVQETIALARGEAEAARIILQLDLASELPMIFGHRVQLQQVILNLVTNAIDAMRGVMDRDRELRIESKRVKTDYVAVAVKDSGTGIEPKNMGRLFDAFFTTKSNGMGMGLSICRSIVEAHGGRLTVAAVHPHGSAFQIVLPSRSP